MGGELRYVTLRGGERVPALGQGTWHMGEDRRRAAEETAALRLGIELGMTLIDTAEMYGSGGAEEVIVAVFCSACLVRMNPGRGVNPIVAVGERKGDTQVVRTVPHTDGKEIAQSRRTRALDHRLAVRLEIGIVKMTMRIDEHS